MMIMISDQPDLLQEHPSSNLIRHGNSALHIKSRERTQVACWSFRGDLPWGSILWCDWLDWETSRRQPVSISTLLSPHRKLASRKCHKTSPFGFKRQSMPTKIAFDVDAGRHKNIDPLVFHQWAPDRPI